MCSCSYVPGAKVPWTFFFWFRRSVRLLYTRYMFFYGSTKLAPILAEFLTKLKPKSKHVSTMQNPLPNPALELFVVISKAQSCWVSIENTGDTNLGSRGGKNYSALPSCLPAELSTSICRCQVTDIPEKHCLVLVYASKYLVRQ